MFTDQDSLIVSEKLEIKYVKVVDAPLWDQNPKLHDTGAIIESITINGFRDPATWDSALQAIVAGNGRTGALQIMEQQGMKAPRGILTDSNGSWYMPVLFGIDADSQEAAIRYAVDHNNLTMMGGDFSMFDVSKMWDKQGYLSILQGLRDDDGENAMPITIDLSDLEALENPVDYTQPLGDEPEEEEEDESPAVKDTKSAESSHMANEKDSINETRTSGALVSVLLTHEILAEDVVEIIEALVDDHPEWEATVKLKYFKPESEYN